MIRLLLKRGADPDTADNDGVTPLKLAEFNKHDKAAEALRKALGQ
jgi:ankyrin repeat protein